MSTAPDPIGILQCPDCDEQFPFSKEGATAYWGHWDRTHVVIPTASARPAMNGTARVTKADGTVYEVPIEGVVI